MTMVGVIGGSGLYVFLAYSVELPAEPPRTINNRANMWAMRGVGARRMLAPCAVGSLRPDRGPGDLVVPDRLVARASGRVHSLDGIDLAFELP